ncbi:MAG: sodium ion-translocating decarboxylase subunit beta, partial [Muribaculaceae bacterium]|nr:sodium ion-translocating decarboxylase subunit beta [Muribaculaceae bacterium]
MNEFSSFLADNVAQFWHLTGCYNATWQHLVMRVGGLFFIWLAIKKDFEPMLLVPIGFGILIGNIPFNATAGLEIG